MALSLLSQCKRVTMVVETHSLCEIQGGTDTQLSDTDLPDVADVIDTGVPIEVLPTDVQQTPPSWIDPCASKHLNLGPSAPAPFGALPVLGNACAQGGWVSPPNPATPVLLEDTAGSGLGALNQLDAAVPCILWQDFNGDGVTDVLVAHPGVIGKETISIRVYPGDGTGHYAAPIISQFGSIDNAAHVADCIAVDLEQDGYVDVAFASVGGAMLWHNGGFGKFTNVSTDLLPVSTAQQAWTIGVVDYDRDMNQDLYVLMTGQLSLAPGKFQCLPADPGYYQCCIGGNPFDPACLAQQSPKDKINLFSCCTGMGSVGAGNILLHKAKNNYADVSAGSALNDLGASLTTIIHDLDRDGWQDVFVGNDFGALSWYRNDGTQFSQHATDLGLRPYGHVMGSCIEDFDHDGWDDLWTADFGPPTLYRGTAKGFTNQSQLANVQNEKDSVGWASLGADFDNDGWTDLLQTQSQVSVPGGLPDSVQGKTGNLAPDGHHQLFHNLGQNFQSSTLPWAAANTPQVDSVVVAANDDDGDGDLDLLLQSPGGAVQLWRNQTNSPGVPVSQHWLAVELNASQSPADGAGALIQVWSQNYLQERQIQTTPGFGAHGQYQTHFGLGQASSIDRVRVWWPTGCVTIVEQPPIDQPLTVLEMNAFCNQNSTVVVPDAGSTDVDAQDAQDGADVPIVSVIPLDLTTLPEAKFTEVTNQFNMAAANTKTQYIKCTLGADLDMDGSDDMLVVEQVNTENFNIHAILHQGDTWTHVLSPIDTSKVIPAEGCNAGDFNGDGKLDLILGEKLGAAIFINQGQGKFVDQSDKYLPSNMDFAGWTAAVGDLDHDGDIEIFFGAGEINSGCTDVYCAYQPGDFGCYYNTPTPASAENQDRIFKRQDLGQAFVDSTSQFKMLPVGGDATNGGFADLDGDGWTDLLITNDFGPSYLLHSNKGALTKLDKNIGLLQYGHFMGFGIGDFNRDGLFDIFMADAGPNPLYMGVQPGAGLPLQWVDGSVAAGVAAATWDESTWNPLVVDFDHDGWEDVYLGIAGYAPNGKLADLGVCKEPAIPAPQRDLFFHNNGDGSFTPSLAPKPTSQAEGFAAVAQSLTDLDGDGDLDILQVRRAGDIHILRNDMAPLGTSVVVRLHAKGGNTLAIGARIEAKIGNQVMVRTQYGNHGFGASGYWNVHFGLGNSPQIDAVTVHWPSGKTTAKGPILAGKIIDMSE